MKTNSPIHQSQWMSNKEFRMMKFDSLKKSHQSRHPGGSRGPELLVVPGFRLSPE